MRLVISIRFLILLAASATAKPFFSAQSVPRWLSGQLSSLEDSRNILLATRGGGAPGAAEPEGVTLHGTVAPTEPLYLPGLLDTAIRRTNKVGALAFRCVVYMYEECNCTVDSASASVGCIFSR